MRRGTCRAAQRRDGPHHVGVQRAPLEGLLRAHRIADDQPDSVDAQVLGDQAVLADHIVVQGDIGECGAIERRREYCSATMTRPLPNIFGTTMK